MHEDRKMDMRTPGERVPGHAAPARVERGVAHGVVVVVTLDRGDQQALEALDDAVGIGALFDHVAQADDLVDTGGLEDV